MGVTCNYTSSILSHSIEESQGSFSDEVFKDKVDYFPMQTEECMKVFLDKESDHLPAGDYAKRLMNSLTDVSARKYAVDWMNKAHKYYRFGPLSAYLSVNYLDRFLSVHELPQGKDWMMQLLAVACLSLAIKMEEIEVPLCIDLQIGSAKYVFEARTIQRMELLVLSSLKWRMQPVTPFSFMDYFVHKFNNDISPREPEINHCINLILVTIKGIDFLEFKPSELAASVILYVLIEEGLLAMEKALNCCSFLEKEKVMQCYKALQDINLMEEKPPISSVPQSPIGVLDAATLSYNSDETINSSQETILNNSPASKRRKLNNTSAL